MPLPVPVPEPEAGAQVFASVPAALIAFSQMLGVSGQELLEASGLQAQELTDPDRLVDYESLPRIWRLLLDRFPDRSLGLEYSRLMRLDALGVVGYACRHARTLGQALDLYVRYATVVDPFIRVRVEDLGDLRRVTLEHQLRVEEMVEPIELMVLATTHIAAQLAAPAPRPVELCFRHRARHDPALYAELADVVRFEAPYTGATFETSLLELPVTGADPRIATYLTRQAQSLLEDQQQPAEPTALDAQVRQAIDAGLLAGAFELPVVAHALAVSPRSLQRGLKELGTSFSEQLDEVRRVRALALLGRRDLSVAEVAFMLGYADPRPFYRSFRRWTGQSPQQFRAAPADLED